MLKNLTKVGSSQALILSKEMLALIGVGEGEQVEVRVYGNTITVSPPQAEKPAAGSSHTEFEMALAYTQIKSKRKALFERLAHQDNP